MLEHRDSLCTEKVAAMGLTSTLTLRASSRGWLGGGGCFLAPSAMAGAESALWWEQRCHPTLKWALLSFLWPVNTVRVPPCGETPGSELVGRW